jgi:lysophospholipase L1-like esterase
MSSTRVHAGCWLAVLGPLLATACGGGSTPSSPSSPVPGPPAAGAAISYTAVGASDALGVGASVTCLPYAPCPSGTGYVAAIARQLQAGHSSVTLMNLGIPAAVIGPDIQAIAIAAGRQVPGNFIDQEMPFVPRDSNVVTIFAGGNDANAIADALNQGAGGNDPSGYVDAQVRAFANDYQTLVRGIRSRSPNAWIVVANLPNLAGAPFTAGYSAIAKQYMQRISVGFTTQAINPLASQSIPVVDLMCDARSYVPGNYSADGFHPNDAGYANIAAEFVKAITTSGYPAPRSSCAQMTLVQ